MAVSALKTWAGGEVLFASDLNAEFANILDNGEDLGWPASKAKDLNGFELTLDGDGDTGIVADSDDRIDFRIQGSDLFRFDGSVASPVNGLDFTASATGSDVSLDAVGSDTDISISLVPKGAGTVKFGTAAFGEVSDVTLAVQVFSY